jgi:predicted HD superfamily hydrolase involved in NAD metabolism
VVKGKLGSQSLSIDEARQWVSPRVSERRLKHIQGVAATARRLAERVGCDANLAELAGWLHDACKENTDKELIAQARAFGLKLHPVEERNGHLLHGPVAAEVVRRELAVTNEDVLQAIAEHTLGAAPMSLLSKAVFLADALEPGRPPDFTGPIWQALEKGTGQDQAPNLDCAVVTTCDLTLQDLLETGRLIHPKMIEVRNFYLEACKKQATSS